MELQVAAGDLNDRLKQFIGLCCWSFSCGGAAGSILGVDAGGRIPRRKTLPNPRISETLRNFSGEYGLLVYCQWKLLRLGKDVLKSTDIGCKSFQSALRGFEGAVIQGFELSHRLDLSLNLGNGSLEILCSQPPAIEENYTVFSPTGNLTV